MTGAVCCRVTIVGERRQVDLAVPATAPITSYIDGVARLCGQQDSDAMPAAWSLAWATGAPFAPELSLAQAGVVDGQVLYLRDVIADEYAGPVVRDVGEQVAAGSGPRGGHRWDARAHALTVAACGLVWLVAWLAALAARHQAGAVAYGSVAAGCGLLLPALARTAGERRLPVPPWLRAAFALTAVPALALAGHAVAATAPAGPTVFAMLAGGLLGAALAYAAVPGVLTCAVLVAVLPGAALSALLATIGAGVTTYASFTAVVAFALLTVAPHTASLTAVFVHEHPPARAAGPGGAAAGNVARAARSGDAAGAAATSTAVPDDPPAGDAVRSATALLVAWSACLALVLGVALVAMAASHSPYAAGAAGCLGLALLLRAGEARLTAEVVPVLVAGVAALFTLLLVQPAHAGGGARGWAMLSGPVAGGLIVYGVWRLIRRPEAPLPAWPSRLTGAGAALGGGSVALAIATTGLFGRIVELGHHL